MSLIIIRHGQSTYNLANLFTGNLDVPLSPLGKEEASEAGKKLKGMIFDTAFTSVLIRAQETLSIILDEINQSAIPVIKDAALNERMYGDLQGLNKSETEAKYGAEQVEIWRRSYEVKPPGGESLEDTYNRVIPYYESEIKPKLKGGGNILIVAHGNSLRALMMYLENISKQDIVKVNIPTGIPRLYNFDSAFKLISVLYL